MREGEGEIWDVWGWRRFMRAVDRCEGNVGVYV